jgi:hypothetical protein
MMRSFTMRPILYTVALLIAVGGCTGIVEAPDEGSGSSVVAVCSSNAYWKDMDKGSELMHPGGKCKNCHDKNPTSPDYKVAGTVYATSHEPDECNGVVGVVMDGGMLETAIVITDRTGRTLPGIAVNSVGNFKLEEVLMPFNVKVVSKGKENKMVMQAPHGDCNACHTQAGTTTEMGGPSAPGRIVVP